MVEAKDVVTVAQGVMVKAVREEMAAGVEERSRIPMLQRVWVFFKTQDN